MGKQIKTDGYVFNFEDSVLDAYVFDSEEHNGVRNQMKSVDVVADFPNEYLFIELKKYHPEYGGMQFICPLCDNKKLIASQCPICNDSEKNIQATVKRIAHDLRCKYCDTALYFFAEDKLNKPINYICVVEGCDSALTLRLNEILSGQIPKGIPQKTNWKRPIVKNIAVVDIEGWNKCDILNHYGQCAAIE